MTNEVTRGGIGVAALPDLNGGGVGPAEDAEQQGREEQELRACAPGGRCQHGADGKDESDGGFLGKPVTDAAAHPVDQEQISDDDCEHSESVADNGGRKKEDADGAEQRGGCCHGLAENAIGAGKGVTRSGLPLPALGCVEETVSEVDEPDGERKSTAAGEA